jgi:hypothetical protein
MFSKSIGILLIVQNKQDSPEDIIFSKFVKKFLTLMEYENSLLSSQKPTFEPSQLNLTHFSYPVSLRSILIYSSIYT